MQDADKFLLKKLITAFKKPDVPQEKGRFLKAKAPTRCRKCGMTFRSELYTMGVRMIGDVPIPAYRRIVIVCPAKCDITDAHDRFEWVE